MPCKFPTAVTEEVWKYTCTFWQGSHRPNGCSWCQDMMELHSCHDKKGHYALQGLLGSTNPSSEISTNLLFYSPLMPGFLSRRNFAICFWPKGNGNTLSNFALFSRCIVISISTKNLANHKLFDNSHSHVSLSVCLIHTAQRYHGHCHSMIWWKTPSRPIRLMIHSLAHSGKLRMLAIHFSWSIIHSHATITSMWSLPVRIHNWCQFRQETDLCVIL